MDRGEFERRYRVQQRGGYGPAFCRDGRGHPVHGRRWCLEKGFGLGVRRDVYDARGRSIFRSGDFVLIDPRYNRGYSSIDAIVRELLLGLD